MVGSSLPDEWAGAFVNVYVGASNIKTAIEIAESSLTEDMYKPIDVSAAWEIEIDEPLAENTDDSDEIPSQSELSDLARDGGVLYGAFHGYPPEPGQVQ